MDTITISLSGIRLNKQNLSIIKQLMDEEMVSEPENLTESPKKASKKAKIVDQVPQNAEKIEPEDQEPATERVALESIVNKTRELVQANRSVEVKKLLGKYDVSRVSDLPENKYNDFYNDLNKI